MENLMLQGLSCPQPVLKTRAFLDENPDALEVLVVVDNRASAENVLRFLESQGFDGSITETINAFNITGTRMRTEDCVNRPEPQSGEEHRKILIVISSDKIGTGEDVLGVKLMLSFVKTLSELGDSLWRLIFLNSGIKLTVEGSEALPWLQQLEAQGVSILVCGTCLDYFQLLEKKKVGQTTNMLDVVMSHQLAEKVITI